MTNGVNRVFGQNVNTYTVKGGVAQRGLSLLLSSSLPPHPPPVLPRFVLILYVGQLSLHQDLSDASDDSFANN